jgi:hypothetical protein
VREIEKPLGTGKDVVPRNEVVEMERMLKRPWKVTVAPGVGEG